MNRNSLLFKPMSIVILYVFLFQIFYPSTVLALTSGPTQPETQSFKSASVTEMVNPFTGDFSYNIPLMDIGGYPISLSYNSGIGMDQEASWVGLGWNINPGVISRNVRGLPDDFHGDNIQKTYSIKKNRTYGLSLNTPVELIGKSGLGISYGTSIKYNNYSGASLDLQLTPSIGAGEGSKSPFTASLGLSIGSSGVGISPSVGLSLKVKETQKVTTNLDVKLGSSFNSRTGLQDMTLGVSPSKRVNGLFIEAKADFDDEIVGKTKNVGVSTMSGGRLSFASPSITPSIQHSFLNKSISLSYSGGFEFFTLDFQGRVGGFYSEQKLKENVTNTPAYGFLYHHEGANASNAVLDFNREKDVGYSPEIDNLPLASATYDIFSVSGEGIGGSYRLFRNDVGTVYDNSNDNRASSVSLGAPEFSLGETFKGGLNVGVNMSESYTSKWEDGNSTYRALKFRRSNSTDLTEPVYFRKSGEKNVMSDESFFNKFGAFEAISFDLNSKTEKLSAQRYFTTTDGRRLGIDDNEQFNLNTNRQARNEAIIHYTATEAKKYGLYDEIREYGINDFDLQADGTYDYAASSERFETNPALINTTARKGHHLSEINVFSADGRRYIYGDPIYNYIKKEVTFATNKGGSPTVDYNNTDNSINNKNGLDHYYNRVITPAYPTAFLLSAIVSHDYVDADKIKGPSDEDLGNYTKFNYTKLGYTYKWRTPFEQGKASLNEGFKTKDAEKAGDNKGTYVYGEKEVKYLHSIETKTHVAEFILSNDVDADQKRRDGYGVLNEEGGRATQRLRKLEEIRLYSKADRLNNPSAVPIKTVHFEYDYTLCSSVPNNDGNGTGNGKLTLKSIYYTYGASNRGVLSPYTFEYGGFDGGTQTASYDTKGVDRWGSYQPNAGSPGNEDFPYTDQDYKIDYFDADKHAAVWNLSQITLPSGGIIEVDYEADDYAYVQDRKAMQMFKVVGFSETATGSFVEQLYSGLIDYNYLKIQLPENYPLPKSVDNPEGEPFDWKDFFYGENGRIDNLYFKMFVNVEVTSQTTNNKEYVVGYAKIDYDTYEPTINGDVITLKLKSSESKNAISMATFNLMKKHFPEIVYQQDRPNSTAIMSVFRTIVGLYTSLADFIGGIDNKLVERSLGKFIEKEKSWVRLYNPLRKKKGGGHRVKKITINDNWSQMAKGNHQDSEYGQEYDYTMIDTDGRIISSGVAAYEPILGNDENPFRQPRFRDEKRLLVPDEKFYMEEPMGEFYFPGASVGYRQVTIKNLQRSNVKKNATGKTVHEFYTAYDFPTITKEVPLKFARKKPNSLLKLLGVVGKDYVSNSQGYVVELNDMHGKKKADWVYQENDDFPYSGVEHKYKQLSEKRIASKDMVIDKEGNITEKYLGVEMDLIADTRHSYSYSFSAGADFNMDGFKLAIVPVVVPMFWPSFTQEKIRYNSIVMNKVIKRHGLLKETIYHSQKSIVGKTKQLLRDAESGEVLLTQTENEYGDPLFSFSYPAYWAYDDMGPVYQSMNLSVYLDNESMVNTYLKAGDKVAIESDGTLTTAWVSNVNGAASKFIDQDGIELNTTEPNTIYLIRIVDPIRTNQQMQKVGSVITKQNPLKDLDGDGELESLVFDQVLQAGAIEFTEQAEVFCNCEELPDGAPFNPYTRGTRGIWKTWRAFNYVSERTQTRENKNVDTRKDGLFSDFSPFWTANPVAGEDWQANYEQWIHTAEATTFNPYGNELESKDALGRYSSALFGYKHALPTAVANNARYQHIAFDGFEDYGSEDCADDHFSFEQDDADKISEEEAHTGKKSIRVPAASSAGNATKLSLRKVIVECDE